MQTAVYFPTRAQDILSRIYSSHRLSVSAPGSSILEVLALVLPLLLTPVGKLT